MRTSAEIKIRECFAGEEKKRKRRGGGVDTFDSLKNSNDQMGKNICNSHHKTAKS